MSTHSMIASEYTIGAERVTLGRTITEADIVMHAGQSGDFYPHHMDEQWCATQPFGRRIAHGTLIIAVAVGLTTDTINPLSMSYGYDRVRFLAPVFIGDTIRCTVRIEAVRPHQRTPDEFAIVDESVLAVNQHDVPVLALTHLYLVHQQRPPVD